VRDTNPGRPRFLVLVGIDGSGKTTLLSTLKVPGLITTSWRELRSHEVPATLAPDAPTQIKNRLPLLSRAMFIGGHLVAQYEYLVRPALEDGVSVLLDSYYFKLLAKERIFGTVHSALEQLCRELPQPDGVIYVDVPPVVSFRRKAGDLSPYEYLAKPEKDDYEAFQSRVAAEIGAMLSTVPSIVVPGVTSVGELREAAAAAAGELMTRVEERTHARRRSV
jgi:thymidylate kinase